MRRPIAALAGLVVAGGVASAGPAHAYVRTTTEDGHAMRWGHACIPVILYTGSPPRFLTIDTFVQAAQLAAATWSNPGLGCTQLRISLSTAPDDSADVGFDYKNRVTFRREEWCKQPRKPTEACYDQSALAITSVFARKSDGTILDADMEINARFFTWADVAAGGAASVGSQDIQNTITHEFGHLIGFDHTCYTPNDRPRPKDSTGIDIPNCSCFGQNGRPPASPSEACVHATARLGEATMFASVQKGDITRRDLSDDDMQGVCDVYPVNGDLPCAPPDSSAGGCCVIARSTPPDPQGSAPALVLAMIGLVGLFRAGARRRARRPGGVDRSARP